MDYLVEAAGRQAGKVQVMKEGLYYHIVCHARLGGSIMYRLAAVTEGRRENIGILSPGGDGFSLDRKVPCSHLNLEGLQFLLLPSHEPMDGRFVPIAPEEPFQYLEKLKDAYLARQHDRIGVVIPD